MRNNRSEDQKQAEEEERRKSIARLEYLEYLNEKEREQVVDS